MNNVNTLNTVWACFAIVVAIFGYHVGNGNLQTTQTENCSNIGDIEILGIE